MDDFRADYFWSARFICGVITLTLGIALLVGGVLFLRYDGLQGRYFTVVGTTCCLSGVLLAMRSRAGLALYALILLGAVTWTLFEFGLDLWALLPQLLALLLWASILFALRHRIAPSRNPSGAPAERFRLLLHNACRAIRESS